MDIHWEAVFGHEQNIARLKTLVQEQRVPHAMLFCGPEGVGKRKVARVFSAALLCTAKKNAPCGACPSCRALRRDMHPDVYALAPESATGAKSIRIDQIREMQSEVARMPLVSERRVVIIDQAETMNDAAANSLLKTLEEPTGNVVFLLVTSMRSGLLDTILSRCMPMNFGALPRAVLSAALERQGMPPQEARALAAMADGSMGRAMHLARHGGLAFRDEAAKFLAELHGMGVEQVWQMSQALGAGREKLAEWLMELNMLLRDILALRHGVDRSLLYHEDRQGELAALLPHFPERRVLAMLRLARMAQRRMAANVNLRLLAEAFLLRMHDLSRGGERCRQS